MVAKVVTTTTTALKAEASDDPIVTFEFEGHKYTFDKSLLENDSDILEMFEEDKVIVPLKRLLGADQYKLFKNRGTNGKRSLKEVADMAEAMFKDVELNPGE